MRILLSAGCVYYSSCDNFKNPSSLVHSSATVRSVRNKSLYIRLDKLVPFLCFENVQFSSQPVDKANHVSLYGPSPPPPPPTRRSSADCLQMVLSQIHFSPKQNHNQLRVFFCCLFCRKFTI